MTELNTFLIMAQAIDVVPVWWLTLAVICTSHALLFASKCLHMLLASSCNQCFGSQVLFLSTTVGPHIFIYFLWHTSYSLTAICTRWTWGAQNGLVIDIWNPWLQTNAQGEMQSAKKVKKAIKTCQTRSAYLKIQATIQFSYVFFPCLLQIFIHKSRPMKLLGRLRLGASNVLAKSLVLIDLKFKHSWFPYCLVLRAAMVCLPASNGGTHDK